MWISWAILVLAACGGAPSPVPPAHEQHPALQHQREPPSTAGNCSAAPTGGSVQAHLQAVAACFHAAVLALNREPSQGESLSAFLGSAGLPGTPNLTLPDGATVAFSVVERSHDDLDDGSASFYTTYRFTAPGHAETAETTIVLTVGGGP